MQPSHTQPLSLSAPQSLDRSADQPMGPADRSAAQPLSTSVPLQKLIAEASGHSSEGPGPQKPRAELPARAERPARLGGSGLRGVRLSAGGKGGWQKKASGLKRQSQKGSNGFMEELVDMFPGGSLKFYDPEFDISFFGIRDPKKEAEYRQFFRDTLISRSQMGLRAMAPFATMLNFLNLARAVYHGEDRGKIAHVALFTLATSMMFVVSIFQWSKQWQKRVGAAAVWAGRFVLIPATIQTCLQDQDKAMFFMAARTLVAGGLVVQSFPEQVFCTVCLTIPCNICRLLQQDGSIDMEYLQFAAFSLCVFAAGILVLGVMHLERRRFSAPPAMKPI